jgi:hypothetical protein
MMGQVVSIEDFRRQYLNRQLKKRLKAAQGDLAKAYRTQRDLIGELRRARCPIQTEQCILEIMEGHCIRNFGRDPEV